MKKKLPSMKTDKAVENLLSEDLSDYIHTGNFRRISFEFEPKDKSITLRLSSKLLETVQEASKSKGMGYQKYIREVLERAVMNEKPGLQRASRVAKTTAARKRAATTRKAVR